MFRIRRFGVIRTANVVAFLYVVIVTVIFVPIALIIAIAAPNAGFGNTGGFAGNAGALAVLFLWLLIAVLYGIFGWIFTAIACLLYNFAAGMIGGIEIQLEAVQPPPPPPVWGGYQAPTTSAPPAPPAAPTEPPSTAPPPTEPPTA